MAKLLSGETIVTIENNGKSNVYKAGHVNISSLTRGNTYNIVVGEADMVGSHTRADVRGYDQFEKLVPLGVESRQEKAMIEAAQLAERAVLDAARIVQKAQTEAQALIENANSQFNQSILAYLHTGKGNVEASKVLEKAGVWATEDRTEAVACFQVDKLYGVDTLETGV